MVININKNGFYITKNTPDYLVDDATFQFIASSRKTQMELLEKFRAKTLVIGRLGTKIGNGIFDLSLPEFKSKRDIIRDSVIERRYNIFEIL